MNSYTNKHDICHDPLIYHVGTIIVGYDGLWYIINKEKNWELLSNSPTNQMIQSRLEKDDFTLDELAFYIDPKDGEQYRDHAWNHDDYAISYAFYLCMKVFDYYGYDPLNILGLNITLRDAKNIIYVKNQLIKSEIIRVSVLGEITKSNEITKLSKFIDIENPLMVDLFEYAQAGQWTLIDWIGFLFNNLYPSSTIEVPHDSKYLMAIQTYLLIREKWFVNDSYFVLFKS